MAGLVSATAVPMQRLARASGPLAPTAQSAQHPPSPESSECALSHLSRLSSGHSLASPSRPQPSKRHALFMRSSKPILQHAVTTTTTTAPAPATPAPSRRRDLPLDDQALPPVGASVTSPLRSLGHLVPHFAEEGETRPRAGLNRQSSLPSTTASTSGSRTAFEEDVHAASFWTLNWSSAVEAVENVLSLAQGLNIPFLPGPEDGGALDGAPHITSFLNPTADPTAAPQQPQQPTLSPQQPQQPQRPAAPAQPFAFVPLPLPLGPSGPPSASAQRRAALQAELETLELMLRPKCPWPRQESPRYPLVDSPLLDEDQEPEGVEQPEPTPSEAETAAAAAAYPRCAWPREAGKAEALASTSSPALAAAAHPRCAWPRQARAADLHTAAPAPQGAPLAYPRSAWPRRTGTKATSTLVAEPETATSTSGTPSLATVAALNSLASVALASAVMAQGPRCAWPREKRAAPLGSSPALLEAGPRCAWPRELGAVPATAAVSAAGILMTTDAAPRCAWPRHQATRTALSSPAPEDALSSHAPRCAWPRTPGPKAVLAPAPASAAAAGALLTTPSSSTPLGPRCEWPRKAAATPAPTPAPAALQLDATAAPRCAWPRQAGIATPLRASVAAAAVSEAVGVQMGPRCAWPRPATAKPLSPSPLPAQSPAEEPAMGPRCAWPRVAASPAPLAAAPAAAVASPSVAVEGPRCAWPRKVQAAPPAAPAAADESPAPLGLGPRCPWPRVGAPKASPSSVEDVAWEVLPALAVEEARKRIPLVAAAALGSGSAAGLSIAGPRCAWPRSLKMAKGAKGMEA